MFNGSLQSRVVISRVLYSNVAIGAMTISLDESLPTASSDLPGYPAGTGRTRFFRTESCLVLHRMRFTVPSLSPGMR